MNVTSVTRNAAAVAAIAATAAIVLPATAVAVPEWDIGAYDRCVRTVQDMYAEGKIAQDSFSDAMRECCERTGGVYSDNGNGYSQCHAPSESRPLLPSDLPAHVFTPVTELAGTGTTQTLTPTP